jgi:hypothetical protein
MNIGVFYRLTCRWKGADEPPRVCAKDMTGMTFKIDSQPVASSTSSRSFIITKTAPPMAVPFNYERTEITYY